MLNQFDRKHSLQADQPRIEHTPLSENLIAVRQSSMSNVFHLTWLELVKVLAVTETTQPKPNYESCDEF